MGNSSTKLAERCSLLTKDEVPIVASSFKLVSKNSDRIKEDDLIKFWGSQMDPRLAQYITNFLFGPLGSRAGVVEFQKFAELYVFCVRGSVDERISVLLSSLGQTETDTSEIAYPLIKEYVEAVVSSYMRAIRLQSGQQYKSWENKGFRIVKECVQKLAESLVFDVVQQGTQKVTRHDAERWLQTNPTFIKMLEHIFTHLYHYRNIQPKIIQDNSVDMQPQQSQQHSQQQLQQQQTQYQQQQQQQQQAQYSQEVTSQFSDTKLLPFCEGLQYVPDYPAFTDISQMLYINSNLPKNYQTKWRFLFSSQIHGESFSTLLGRIMDQGPTVIIVEDSNGYIFGGFAPCSWSLSPNYTGTDDSFLFTLRPKMRCFVSTGYNNHFQYLNLHQQTMPNGLGMGGVFNYWGLWLDSEYGKGECSESCTTFKNYLQLSASKNFIIRNVEVWAVADKPVKNEDDDENPTNSVLDGNVESKALLELMGKSQYSEAYRDEPVT